MIPALDEFLEKWIAILGKGDWQEPASLSRLNFD
jgi:hypothetical protein